MWSLLQIILPICLLVMLGFSLRWFGLVKPDADEIIGDLVFKVAIPVLLFRLIAISQLEGANPWAIWASYFIPVAIVWIFASILLPLAFKREALYGLIGGTASGFANTVLVGIPLILQAYGEAGMVSLTILLSVHLPVMFFAAAVHHDIAVAIDGKGGQPEESWPQKISRLVITVLKNPIIIGIIAGSAFRVSGLEMPVILLDVTGKISSIAGPLALIVLGMGLNKYGLKGNVGPATITTFLKLLVLPGLVFFFSAYVFNQPPMFTAGLVLASAAPTGVNAYLFSQHFGTGHALAANSISISTPLCVFTITFWLGVLAAYMSAG